MKELSGKTVKSRGVLRVGVMGTNHARLHSSW